MIKERFKKVKDHKDYIVSSWARVFCLRTGLIVKPHLNYSRAGVYFRVNIDGKKYFLQNVVGKTFLKKEHEGQTQINHKDRNHLNCNLSNLEWSSQSENIKHMIETSVIKFNGKTYRLNERKKNKCKK